MTLQTYSTVTEDPHPADRIADFLEENGWVRYSFHRKDVGYCTVGAGQAIYGIFNPGMKEYEALKERLGLGPCHAVSVWNDTQPDKATVLRKLRGQADG